MTEQRRSDVVRALVDGNTDLHRLYMTSAMFRYSIDNLAAFIPMLVDAFAAAAREEHGRIQTEIAHRIRGELTIPEEL